MPPATDAPAGIWIAGRRALTIGLVATITLFASEALAVATIMPRVADELGRSGYGAAFSAFFLGQVVGVLVAGPAADRYGPSRPFLVAALLFGAGLVVGGTAVNIWVLVGGRALQGAGAGASVPVIYAIIGRTYDERDRIRMFAITSTAWVVPAVVGPVLAGVVAESVGWRWVFLGLLPLVGIATVIMLPSMRDLPPMGTSHQRLRLGEASAFAAGTALVLGAPDAHRWWPAAVAVGVAIAAVPAKRFIPAGLLRLRRGLPATVALRGLLTYSFVAADSFLPFAVTDVRHSSLLVASVAVASATLMWTVGAWVADRQVPRRGSPTVIRWGLATLGIGLVVESALLVTGWPIVIGIVGGGIAGFGIGMAYSPQSTLVLDSAEPGREGVNSSALSLFDGLGFAVGPAVSGALVVHSGWTPGTALAVSWLVAAAVALAATTATGRLRM